MTFPFFNQIEAWFQLSPTAKAAFAIIAKPKLAMIKGWQARFKVLALETGEAFRFLYLVYGRWGPVFSRFLK
jgi:hypothetical protein